MPEELTLLTNNEHYPDVPTLREALLAEHEARLKAERERDAAIADGAAFRALVVQCFGPTFPGHSNDAAWLVGCALGELALLRASLTVRPMCDLETRLGIRGNRNA
jgi:hypothetical protein